MNYHYIKDFHKSREARIGASDIPHIIPHPTIQIESLAAYTKDGKRYPCTALDLYNEKINPSPWEYNFPAEMGHYLEGRALYEFIADNISWTMANDFLKGYQMHKMEQEKQVLDHGHPNLCINPEPYNSTPFKHNTEALVDYGVAHGDCLYVPENSFNNSLPDVNHMGIIKINGLTIDLSKPFLIEAKSARLYTVSARKKDPYKGYDLSLKQWQGIPLKVYFQLQYQMYLYNVDMSYLSLIFDTSEKHYWQIKANKKHQQEIVQLASYMKQCIDSKTPPKQLVMNNKDIQKLYPVIKDDFREVSGDELSELLIIASGMRQAAEQEKNWKKKKEDANERMSIHLKDTDMIKGVVNDTLQTIAKWKKTGGGSGVMGLKDIGEREDGKKLLRYLKKNKLIKDKSTGRSPVVVIKGEELG